MSTFPQSFPVAGFASGGDDGNPFSSSIAQFMGFGALFGTLGSMFSPTLGISLDTLLGSSSIKLLLLGTLIETGRRLCRWFVERFRFQYSITAHFEDGDPAYEWIILFLTQENVWRRSREFQVNATNSRRKWGIRLQDKNKLRNDKENADYVPTYGVPQLFWWNGYWVEIKRDRSLMTPVPGGPVSCNGGISVTIYTLRVEVLSLLVEEARRRYVDVSRPHVTIHMADNANFGPGFMWNNTKHKTRRPLSSIILQEGVLQALAQDAQDFIDSEDWYVEAGIPHRRGYLLYGPPGTGKTSTIYALAGELNLEIYTLSLAAHYVDDAMLGRAVSSIPKHSILLIEDIDCAFPSREEMEMLEEGGAAAPVIPGMPVIIPPGPSPFGGGMVQMQRRSAVTLSGLLNVIDGVGSEEGRLFFATTNYIDRLDPALLRPGRIDRKIEYTHATQSQGAALYRRFFPASRFGHIKLDPDVLERLPGTRLTPVASTSAHEPQSDAVDLDNSQPRQSGSALLSHLAELFGSQLPPEEFTTAELQGYLLSCKTQPMEAVMGINQWIQEERDQKKRKMEREQERKERLKEKRREGVEHLNKLFVGAGPNSTTSPGSHKEVKLPPTPPAEPSSPSSLAPSAAANAQTTTSPPLANPVPIIPPLFDSDALQLQLVG